MKILKLISLFLVVLGIVVGSLFIKSIINDSESDDITITLPDDAAQQRAEIEDFWSHTQDWKQKHFEEEYTNIQQCLGAKFIDQEAANQLTSLLCNLVINRMLDLQKTEYHKSNCNINIVKGYMKGIDAVCHKDMSYNNDDRVKMLRDLEKLYHEIHIFANSSFCPDNKLSENTDGTHSWLDYKTYAQGRRQQASDYRNNSYYREYLSNIEELKNGISEASVNSRLISGKKSYGLALANAIAAAYEKIPADEVKQATFNNITNDYHSFFPEYGRNNDSADDVMSAELRKVKERMEQNSQ